jgi:DNA-binding phage protein
LIVIQLSDPHILAPGELLYRRFDTAEFLARAVGEINRLDPLPDVAASANAATMRMARRISESLRPYLVIMSAIIRSIGVRSRSDMLLLYRRDSVSPGSPRFERTRGS